MNSNYGFDLATVANKPEKIVHLLGQFLNDGNLGLLLGAGLSIALELPSWFTLVNRLADDKLPGIFDPAKTYSTTELKELTDDIKKKFPNTKEYVQAVKHYLYAGITEYDFKRANKDLLIGISALIVGKNRGTVSDIITYNFDNVLQWYLNILGLKVDTFTKKEYLKKNADVIIAHIHGYLPLDSSDDSKEIIFSNEEFIDRQLSTDYWKEYFYEFFRRHTFLTVGLSAESVYNDLCPHLRWMNTWYQKENIKRRIPYGVALLTPGPITDKRFDDLINTGIIPCILEKDQIPDIIFKVAQHAVKSNSNTRVKTIK